ncbi:cartilage matrix protein-like [Haliotis cracherodii]|uniref:cartilage matrix protein-like n=1 Tax=Haliotis cracherodii TaxID=6455 RepID=UPI0039EBFAE5
MEGDEHQLSAPVADRYSSGTSSTVDQERVLPLRSKLLSGIAGVHPKTATSKLPVSKLTGPMNASVYLAITEMEDLLARLLVRSTDALLVATSDVAKDRCLETPCQNAGICTSNATNFSCRCLLGYSGPLCEKKCEQQKMDILLIEDVSSSISKEEYRKIKDFEIEMVSYSHINSSIVNVALMVYAGKARLVFPLNAYSDNKTAAVNAVNAPHLVGGSTFLGDAINLAVSDVFVQSNGDRPDAANVVILFTDGKSSKKSAILKNFGRLLTEATVYVVPISTDTDMVDIAEVAAAPDEEHVFSMSNPLALDEIKERTIYEHCGRDVALKE